MSCSQKTVKILVLPGGGIRGIFQQRFMEIFCSSAGIDPAKIYDYFDIICGTSIGGITAMGYAYGLTPSYMLDFLRSEGPTIFTPTGSYPKYQIGVMMGIYGYPDPDSEPCTTMYSRTPLLSAINAAIPSTTTLNQLNGRVIVSSWDLDESKQTFFSNISGMHYPNGETVFVGSNQLCSTVGLCTSAAPLYFPRMKNVDLGDGFGPHSYTDGGVFANNPVPIAVSAAKTLYPSSTRCCILSVGTGVAQNPLVFDTSIISPTPYNVQYVTYLLDNVFIPGPQEFNDSVASLMTGDLFNDIFYYSFNHKFLPGEDSSLDNASTTNMDALEGYADDEYLADDHNIEQFIEHLNADL